MNTMKERAGLAEGGPSGVWRGLGRPGPGGRWAVFVVVLGAVGVEGRLAEGVGLSRSKERRWPFALKHSGHRVHWGLRLEVDHRSWFRGRRLRPRREAGQRVQGARFSGPLVWSPGGGAPRGGEKPWQTRGERPTRNTRKLSTTLKTTAGGWSLTGGVTLPTARVRIVLSGAKGSPRVTVQTEITYRTGTYVRREALLFRFPCQRVFYLDRGEARRRVVGRGWHRVDRWTHKRVDVVHGKTLWGLVAAPALSGVALRRLKGGGKGGSSKAPGCVMALELDDARNHPAVYASRCKRYWNPPSPRRRRSRRFRRRGEKVSRTAHFHLGSSLLVHKARLPHGYAAAVVFSDHADQAAPGPLKALLLGRSDASFSKPSGGFVGHGLHFTKTLFHRRAPYPQMGNAGVRALVKGASKRGIEFGPHSASPYPDSRRATDAALKAFSPWGSTWIDHQPDTNCEAYSCRGWAQNSRFFIADLLVKRGFPFVWSGHDVKLRRGRLNLLKQASPAERASFFYPFHVSPKHKGRLWLFRSSWFYVGPKAFSRRLSRAGLKKLVRQRGVFVAHTYLDAHHGPGHRRHGLALIRRDAKGTWFLHSKADAALGRLARAQRARELWVPSVQELGRHLQAWQEVTLVPQGPRRVTLTNHGRRQVSGLTFRVRGRVSARPRAQARPVAASVAASAPSSRPRRKNKSVSVTQKHGKKWTSFVLEIPPFSRVTVRLTSQPPVPRSRK